MLCILSGRDKADLGLWNHMVRPSPDSFPPAEKQTAPCSLSIWMLPVAGDVCSSCLLQKWGNSHRMVSGAHRERGLGQDSTDHLTSMRSFSVWGHGGPLGFLELVSLKPLSGSPWKACFVPFLQYTDSLGKHCMYIMRRETLAGYTSGSIVAFIFKGNWPCLYSGSVHWELVERPTLCSYDLGLTSVHLNWDFSVHIDQVGIL